MSDYDLSNRLDTRRLTSPAMIMTQFWPLVLMAINVARLEAAPNILMISVEDLGWGDVSWNNPEVVMPNIATLASSGVILGQTTEIKSTNYYQCLLRRSLRSTFKWSFTVRNPDRKIPLKVGKRRHSSLYHINIPGQVSSSSPPLTSSLLGCLWTSSCSPSTWPP